MAILLEELPVALVESLKLGPVGNRCMSSGRTECTRNQYIENGWGSALASAERTESPANVSC